MRFSEIYHFFGEEKANGGAVAASKKSRHAYAPSIATANASTAANTSQNCFPPLVVVVLLLQHHLVHFYMPLAFLLEAFDIVLEVDALRGAHVFQHPQHAWHHALEAAKVHERSFVEPIENVIGVLLHLVLDVHLAAL